MRRNNLPLKNPNAIISKSINVRNENRLRQIYEVGIKMINPIKKQDHLQSFHLPTPLKKIDAEKKSERYQQYFENSLHNQHRYSIPPVTDRQKSYRNKHQFSKRNSIYQTNQTQLINQSLNKPSSTHNQSARIFNIKKKIPIKNPIQSTNIKPETFPLDYFDEGYELYVNGKYDEALKQFQLGIQNQPLKFNNYYYAALILLNNLKYQQGYQYLSKIIKNNPLYKKSTFLLAAVAKKNTINNKPNQQSNQISQHLYKYQQTDQEKIEIAIRICSQGLTHYPDYIQLIICKAKLYQMLKKYQQAHKQYVLALSLQQNNTQALIGDYQCFKQMGSLNSALNRLNQAYFLQKTNQGKYNILSNRIKLQLQMDRIVEARKDVDKLLTLMPQSSQSYLINGLMYIRQKHIKFAIIQFQKCLNVGNCRESMCQALIEITKIKIQGRDFYSALHHINRSDHLQIIDSSIKIYQLFTEGVIFLMKRKIQQGVSNFNRIIQNKYQLSMYPFIENIFYLYRAFGYFMLNQHQKAIQDYVKSESYAPKDKNTTYNQLIAQGIIQCKVNPQLAFKHFQKAQTIISSKIQPFIYRAVTHVQRAKSMEQIQSLQEIFVGLKQLDKAYQTNDSNSNLLFIRSLIYMYLGKVEQGLQDIVKAISKSQQNVPKYFFFRSLAHSSLKNKKQSVNDLNICINLDDNFTLAYLERAKVHFHNININKGLEDLSKYQQVRIKHQRQKIKPTIDTQIPIYKNHDSKYHQFWLYFTLKMYDKAQNTLSQIQNPQLKITLKTYLYLKQSRIKQAKQLMIGLADRFICDIILGNQITTQQLDLLSDSHKHIILSNQSKKITQQAQIGLKYFTMAQYYHYLGVLNYKLNQFEQAINNFTLALKQRSLFDLQQGLNHKDTNQNNQGDQSEDLNLFQVTQSEVNCIQFNLFLCYLKTNQIKKAYQIFIRDILPSNETYLKSEEMGQFSHALFQSMKKIQQNTNKMVQTSSKAVTFTLPLMVTQYSFFTPTIHIVLPQFTLITKLSLPVPDPTQYLKPYNLSINSDFILDCIKIAEVENRPQPPWVKRNQEGLIFTDQIRQINVQFQTTMNDEEQSEQQDEEYDQEAEEQQQQDQQQQEEIDIKTFKDKMKLDDDIQRKLRKIMEKKSS